MMLGANYASSITNVICIMNTFPTPAEARAAHKKETNTTYIRRILIAIALQKGGKAFTFSQSAFKTKKTEAKLLAEIESQGWKYDLVPDHSDGNYYLIQPVS